MQELSGLILHGAHDFRVTMPGGDDGDSRVEIQKPVPIHVGHHGAFAALDDQRIAARIGRGKNTSIPVDDRRGARAGQRTFQRWQVHADSFQSIHNDVLLIILTNERGPLGWEGS